MYFLKCILYEKSSIKAIGISLNTSQKRHYLIKELRGTASSQANKPASDYKIYPPLVSSSRLSTSGLIPSPSRKVRFRQAGRGILPHPFSHTPSTQYMYCMYQAPEISGKHRL